MKPLLTWIWFGLWIAAGAAVGAVWLVRLYFLKLAYRDRRLLTPHSPASWSSDAPRLSIIVAAKDEEANIERCVTSLLKQDYPDYEVIAVDDRSADETPAILKRLAERFPDRLTVRTVTQLRDGWFGKNNAMREGVAAANGAWLLFTDADCTFDSPHTLSVAMREATSHHLGMLSVQPMLETPTWWEKIIQPVCSFALILWFVPRKVNNPTRKTAYATGMFMLFSRSCYEAIGGHERVRTEVNEDIRFARFVKREGHRLRVEENEGLYRVRMYATPRQAFRGWSRIFYGSLTQPRRLLISILNQLGYTILPWAGLIVAAVGASHAEGDAVWAWVGALIASAFAVACQQIMLWRFYGLVHTPRIWSLAYVLGSLAAVAMFASAMMQAWGLSHTTWRGTSYRGASVASGHKPTAPEAPPPEQEITAVDSTVRNS